MRYEIENGEVLEVSEVITATQTAIVKVGRGRDRKIILTADKVSIAADGIEKAVITAKLQDWQGADILQAVNVKFTLNGADIDKVTDQGQTTIEFTSFTAGLYQIMCTAEGYDTGIVEVLSNAA